MSACRRHYPGRIDGTDSLIAVPSTSAFPTLQLGQLLHYQFRGLLGVYSRYDLQTRQVALCDPLHRRLRRLCCLYRRSDCYRVERSSSRAGLSPAVVQRLSRRTVMACSQVVSLLEPACMLGPQKKEAWWFLIERHLRRYRPSPRSKRQRTRKATVRERVSSPILMKVFPLWVPA
jgi:hypothetical protein